MWKQGIASNHAIVATCDADGVECLDDVCSPDNSDIELYEIEQLLAQLDRNTAEP